MKSGIYKLYWPNTPYYYIGSSKDIHYRFRQHITAIVRKDNTFNIQVISNQFGLPQLTILEFCSWNDLELRELHHFKQYKDRNHCLNKNIPGKKPLKAHSESTFLRLLNKK